MNNFIEDKNTKDPIDSSQLSYVFLKEEGNQVSKAADSTSNMRQQCV